MKVNSEETSMVSEAKCMAQAKWNLLVRNSFILVNLYAIGCMARGNISLRMGRSTKETLRMGFSMARVCSSRRIKSCLVIGKLDNMWGKKSRNGLNRKKKTMKAMKKNPNHRKDHLKKLNPRSKKRTQ